MNLASEFESLVLTGQCCEHVTWKNILANVFKQKLVSWPREPNINGRLASVLIRDSH